MCKVCEKGELSLEDKNKIFKFIISDIKEIYFTTFLKYHNNKYKELKKKDWENCSHEEREFYNEWSSKFDEDYGSTTEDKELKYLETGDYFVDDRILMVNVAEKYVVTMTDYGYIRIYLIKSCYSASKATGLVNYKL